MKALLSPGTACSEDNVDTWENNRLAPTGKKLLNVQDGPYEVGIVPVLPGYRERSDHSFHSTEQLPSTEGLTRRQRRDREQFPHEAVLTDCIRLQEGHSEGCIEHRNASTLHMWPHIQFRTYDAGYNTYENSRTDIDDLFSGPQVYLNPQVHEQWSGYRPRMPAARAGELLYSSSKCMWGDHHPVHGKAAELSKYKDLPRSKRVYIKGDSDDPAIALRAKDCRYSVYVSEKDERWRTKPGKEKQFRVELAHRGAELQRRKEAKASEGVRPAGVPAAQVHAIDQRIIEDVFPGGNKETEFSNKHIHGPYRMPRAADRPRGGTPRGRGAGGGGGGEGGATTPRDKDGWINTTPRGGGRRSKSVTSISLMSSKTSESADPGPPSSKNQRSKTPRLDWTLESTLYKHPDLTS